MGKFIAQEHLLIPVGKQSSGIPVIVYRHNHHITGLPGWNTRQMHAALLPSTSVVSGSTLSGSLSFSLRKELSSIHASLGQHYASDAERLSRQVHTHGGKACIENRKAEIYKWRIL